MNGNYIDLIIIFILIYFVGNAWRYGFFLIIADFLSFLLSLLISLRVYKFVSVFLNSNFNLGKSISDAGGFLISAILIETILGQIFYWLVSKFPEKVRKSKINKYLGILPALGEGIIFSAFILTLFISLPVKPSVKKDITSSKIGNFLIIKTSSLEKTVNQVFGGIIEDSLTYFTVKPGSQETVKLDSEAGELKVDGTDEKQMLNLVNEERKKLGIAELSLFAPLSEVARAHAKDMWQRSYFSHYSPEGKDVGDRLNGAGVKFMLAGENLALAPTLQTAHTGLMNSKGHRENILEPKFKKVGIGVIDNGIYGKIYVQIFTD